MTTMQSHLTAACMWAHRTFELLPPAVQRDEAATIAAITDRAIADGWDGARRDAAINYAAGLSRAGRVTV